VHAKQAADPRLGIEARVLSGYFPSTKIGSHEKLADEIPVKSEEAELNLRVDLLH
jgi:hypothetical protein